MALSNPLHTLTSADFPLRSIGNNVYRRTMSSPLFTAPSSEMAAHLALRLNRDDQVYPTSP